MAQMNLTILAGVEQVDPEVLTKDQASLYVAFEQVKDGRKAKGKRYPLPLLLTLLLLGKLAGETTVNGVVDWVKERKWQLKRALNWPKDFPWNGTYSEALAVCSGQEIAEAIAQVILRARAEEHCDNEPSRLQHEQREEQQLIHTAMDGKTLRGTLGHAQEEHPPVHLLSFYECQTGIVLTQRALRSKENEITAAGALLHPLLVKGRIISVDAMHTQKKWCAGVHSYGGHYLVIAKENQPGVLHDLMDFFADKELDGGEWRTHKKVQKRHGRLEVREIWTSTQMNEWFAKEWAGVAQIFHIRRSVKDGEKGHEEMVYGLTNLPRKKVNAEQLLTLNQQHWSIENRLHYRRDVTLGEDACQVRIKGAPEALAALNGGILALMDWLGVSNVASHMRHLCAQYHEALQLLLGKLSR
jgi:predicted transposase YbfD/YdcC